MNKKTIIIVVVVALLGFLGYFFFAHGDAQGFLAAYNIYDAASTLEEAAAHAPGAGENVSRRKLNDMLSLVLTAEMTAEERRQLSEEALLSVAKIRAEIDAIGREGEKADTALRGLREASKNTDGFFTRSKARSVVALAEDRAETIRDIQEISSEINRKLEDIFRGIIADAGALTPERINTLNQALPKAEKQFDRLTENYRRLDDIRKKIGITQSEISDNL